MKAKKIFISYRHTGEDPKELEETLSGIKNSLEKRGHEVFCSYFMSSQFEKQKMSTPEIYEYCLEEQKKYEHILLFVKNNKPSTGMNKEVNLAKTLEQKITLLNPIEPHCELYVEDAHNILLYENFKDLYNKLELVF